MTAAGNLNRRLVLEAPSETDDGAGGVTRVYEAVTKVWARTLPVSARPDLSADNLGATLRYRIIVRRGIEITARHRLRDGNRVLRIVALKTSPDRRFIEIDAEARDD